MKKMIFTTGILPALDYFTDSLMSACERNGWPYTVARMGEELTGQQFATWVTSGEDCAVVMFNNVGLGLTMGERNFWEAHHVPVHDILVDHPRAFYKYLDAPIAGLRFYCIDRNHVSFVRRFYPRAEVSFLPHGGDQAGGEIPWEERPCDVLLVSSCQGRQQFFHIERLPDKGASFYAMLIPALIEQDTVTTEAAIRSYLAQEGLSDDALEKHLNEEYAFAVESRVRREYKKPLMRAMSDARIRMEVYGGNWDDEGEQYFEGIHLHERISARECNLLMSGAKFALNAMPWFKDGSHERIYNAMCNGAIAVTDRSVYLDETLTDGENVIFYDRKHPEEAAQRIRYLLSHPEEAAQIAERGRQYAQKEGTWEKRLLQIIYDQSVPY
ncbi:MAG: glycosyltransferase family 1 protein [Lachnospiraceae bacterium]|nr:glycosyltransferase family 1 protein [Lachnospiraceae bacterium]